MYISYILIIKYKLYYDKYAVTTQTIPIKHMMFRIIYMDQAFSIHSRNSVKLFQTHNTALGDENCKDTSCFNHNYPI